MSEESREARPLIHHHHKKLIIFFIFLLIVFALVYFAFEGSIPFTGYVISGGNVGNNSIDMNAKLSLYKGTISVDNFVEEIEIKASKPRTMLYVGSENEFDLSESDRVDIVIRNFEGEIVFNSDKIVSLDGNADDVYINNIPTRAQTGDKIDVYISEEMSYNLINLKQGVFKPLSYTASGTIDLDSKKININLDNDKIKTGVLQGTLGMGDFTDFGVVKNELRFSGRTTSLDVEGKFTAEG